MNLAWDHWHIEASSICTLRCPRCPRTEVSETLLNKQLTLNFFQSQIGEAVIKRIRKITFCGNDGDPIYCKDFVDICAWIKYVNPEISLVVITNGSYKTAEWWHQLSRILGVNDEIHWSIDGVDDYTNQQYRVNSNWNSIVDGISAFTANNNTTYRVWASIGFKFNQDLIDQQQHLARTLGFDLYQLTKSTKFGSKYPDAYGNNDPLEPTDKTLMSSGFRFERETVALTSKTRPGSLLKVLFQQRASELKQENNGAICGIGNKGVFLNSQGHFYPCCWVANRYHHNQEWIDRSSKFFNLNQKKFLEIITDTYWSTDFLKFDNLECRTKCTVQRLEDPHHTTEW